MQRFIILACPRNRVLLLQFEAKEAAVIKKRPVKFQETQVE